MTTVNFTIDGLAACFQENRLWNIWYPTDATHQVFFWFTRAGQPEQGGWSLAEKTIAITVQGADKIPPGEHPSFSHVLDLSGPLLHSDRLEKVPAISAGANSKMTLENTTLGTAQFRSGYEAYLDNPERIIAYNWAKTIGGEISVGNGGSVIVEVPGDSNFPIQLNPGDSFRIDNYCPDPTPGTDIPNDFLMYYQLFNATDAAQFDLRSREYTQRAFGIKNNANPTGMDTNPPTVCDGVRVRLKNP
jgi:hypothetical protein